MPQQSSAHTDRRRAESFGVAAEQYDRHRPRYPEPLIAGRRLAVLANRIHPTSPTQQELDEINADYLDVTARPSVNNEEEVIGLIKVCGFSVERRRWVEDLHYSTEDYLNLVSTYSNRLQLDPAAQHELRARLAERIGPGGVDAQNDALAMVCTPTR